MQDSVNLGMFPLKKKVLIVDDSPFVLFTTKNMLNTLNVPCVSVCSGADAIDIIKNNGEEFAFIFMDCNMPMLDGIEVSLLILDILF